MQDIDIKSIADVAPYAGPHALERIRFRSVGRALGVSAWGMNVLELEPECSTYPEHNHIKDGQEEVYVVLEGSLSLVVSGEERELKAGDMVRVPPEVTRKFVTRREGATLLAIGGTPGKAYPTGS